jgi:KaiC/GvpD/RAD55 family RecA-like ATPase
MVTENFIERLSYNDPNKWTWEENVKEFTDPKFASFGNLLKMFPGQMIAVVGSSEAGKSTFLLQFFAHQAKTNDRHYLICGPEKDMIENARDIRDMVGKGHEGFIIQHFDFFESSKGLMNKDVLIHSFREIIQDRKNDGFPVTDILIDPMNSIFNEKDEMLGYNERIPFLVAYKEIAKEYGVTAWFTDHSKTRTRFQGKYNELNDPEDFVSGREIHNKVDAFIVVDRVTKTHEEVIAGESKTSIELTNIVKIQNLKTKYSKHYRRGIMYGTFNVNTSRYQFGDEPAWSEYDKRYVMHGNFVTPLEIFDKKLASQENNLQIAKESNTEPPF